VDRHCTGHSDDVLIHVYRLEYDGGMVIRAFLLFLLAAALVGGGKACGGYCCAKNENGNLKKEKEWFTERERDNGGREMTTNGEGGTNRRGSICIDQERGDGRLGFGCWDVSLTPLPLHVFESRWRDAIIWVR
jgi:hypothetical protein